MMVPGGEDCTCIDIRTSDIVSMWWLEGVSVSLLVVVSMAVSMRTCQYTPCFLTLCTVWNHLVHILKPYCLWCRYMYMLIINYKKATWKWMNVLVWFQTFLSSSGTKRVKWLANISLNLPPERTTETVVS